MTFEFEIINKFFKKKTSVPLGIGDDAALINKNSKEYWAISQDTLNLNTHFLPNTPAKDLGWKSLAVNISDIYAMGAEPKYALLSIAINNKSSNWVSDFSKGLLACAKKYGVEIIGGDTTRGQTSISISILGSIFKKNILKRSGAKLGDDIWVTGELGTAALGFAYLKKKVRLKKSLAKSSTQKLQKPKPPNIRTKELYKYFNSAIDISDGLVPDLTHLIESSNLGAEVFSKYLPVNAYIKKNKIYDLALYGGDDYELVLTACKKNRNVISNLAKNGKIKISRIGKITLNKKLLVYDLNESPIKKLKKGFTHFS